MTLQSDTSGFRNAMLLVLGCTLFRLVYSGTFLLAPDETNYWQWSRYLAWGYHDQAPMIAWAIRLSTTIIGHSETAVRLPSVVAMTVASAYLVCIANRWMGSKTAFFTALLSQGILEFNVGGLMATPDGLQAAAWAGACYHVARAYEDNRWKQWLWGGLWFGFGMLSKYTMVIFLPCAYLYGLLSSEHRSRLAGIRPYAGVLIGCLMFFPVILWNAQNNWNSVRHVAYIGGAGQRFSLHWKYFGDYIASQAALLSPLVFLLGLWAWILAMSYRYRTRHWIYPYLFFTSFPMFAGFALLSLHSRVYGNWPAAGYLTVAVLVAAFFTGKSDTLFKTSQKNWGYKLMPWAVGTAYLFTFLVLLQVVWPVLPIPTRLDRTATELAGWEELGNETDRILRAMPDPQNTFVFGLRYQTASELAFYMPGRPQTVSINRWKRPNVYDYWWQDADLIGKDAVGVTYDPSSHQTRLHQVFERVDPPVKLTIFKRKGFLRRKITDEPVEHFYIYRAYRFKGGLRWIPPDRSDIRAG